MNDKWGLLLFTGILLGIFFLAKKTPIQTMANRPLPQPRITLIPQITPQNSYDNEEVREIEYNNDGLPVRITIHRHAKAA